MPFIIYLAIMVLMLVIADLTRPVPKAPKRPGLSEFEVPTADATRKIPVIWGRPMMRGPNVSWYGDLRIEKIIKKVKGVFKDKKYTAGYKYFIGLHMAFCVSSGDVRLLRIQVDGDDVWTGNLLNGSGSINKPSLWGGDEEGGGIDGTFDWCSGGSGQGQNSYLRSVLGPRVPAYRSTARLVWRGGYLGTSRYIKEWAVQALRLPTSLGSGYHDINGEANPAEMLYEILMNKIWGLGTSNLDVEISTFLAAAKTLHDEEFGMSLIWDGAKTLRDISDDICAHIDATMFTNVLTGKWELRLSRQLTQAEIDVLPVFNEDSIQDLESFSRPTLDETTNEVNVIWTQDGETTKWPAKAQDLGLYQVHDRQFVSVDNVYQGVTNYELAQRLATRDLRTLSYPTVKVAFKTNRTAYGLKPTSRFRFTWKPLGIENMVMIVIGIDYGTLDDNIISIDAVQDVYSLGSGLYTRGGSSGWVPPSRNPLPPSLFRMEFTPYWLMRVDPDIQNPEAAVPLLMVEAPSSTHLSYDVKYQDPTTGGAWAPGDEGLPFTPTGVLAYDYLETVGTDTSGTLILKDLVGVAGLTAPSLSEIQYLGEGLLVVGSEWMAIGGVEARPDGSYAVTRVYRGLLDSTIQRHLAGTKAWFVSLGVGRTPSELDPFATGTYRARLISRALGGLLAEAAAPTASISATASSARPLLPYPPRDLALNGSKVPTAVPNTDLVATWKHRNRAGEEYIYLHETSTTQTLETGTTYVCRLYDDESKLLHTSPALTTTTYTFPMAGKLPAAGYITVQAERGGVYKSAAVTLWFGLSVDYALTADAAPQRFLMDAEPWQFWRMSD